MNFDLFMYGFALILLSFISAMIGFAFNKMMEPNMIFHWYALFLQWLAWKEHKTIKGRLLNKMVKSKSRMLQYLGTRYIYKYGLVYTKQSKFLYYIAKPLGLCIICNTCWIGMIVTAILTKDFTWTGILNIVLVGLVSTAFVVLIENKFKQLQRG